MYAYELSGCGYESRCSDWNECKIFENKLITKNHRIQKKKNKKKRRGEKIFEIKYGSCRILKYGE